jgi:uncharacterized surface protein with fasciclin (FAS1) repeats
MRKLTIILAAFAALLIAVPAATAAPARGKAPKKDIVETAVAAGQFKTLVSLVKAAGLAETLSGKGPYTVFAPTDAAFRKVPRSTLRSLQNDRAELRRVLLNHVLTGRYRAARLTRAGSVTTLAGPRLHVTTRGERVRVAGARVVQANVGASNGVVHAINRVLIPPSG